MQGAGQLQQVGSWATFGNGLIHTQRPHGLFQDTAIAHGIVDRGGDKIGRQIDVANRTGGASRVGQTDLISFGTFNHSVIDRVEIDHQIRHRIAVTGVSQSRAIEGQIAASCNGCVDCRHKIRIVRRGRLNVGKAQLDSRRFTGLQYSTQCDCVLCRAAFIDGRITRQAPNNLVIVSDRSHDDGWAICDNIAAGRAVRIGNRNLEVFTTLNQAIINCFDLDAQITHRAAITGKGQRRAIEGQRPRPRVGCNRIINGSNEVPIVGSNRCHVSDVQINRRRFTGLQRAGKVHDILRISSFSNNRITRDVPDCRVVIRDRGSHNRGARCRNIAASRRSRIRDRNLEVLVAFNQSIVNRFDFNAKITHRATIAGKGQRRPIEGQRPWPRVVRNRIVDCADKILKVRANRCDVADIQIDRCRFTSLQRSSQIHNVLRIGSFRDGCVTRDTPGCNIVVGNRCDNNRWTGSQNRTSSCSARVGD